MPENVSGKAVVLSTFLRCFLRRMFTVLSAIRGCDVINCLAYSASILLEDFIHEYCHEIHRESCR